MPVRTSESPEPNEHDDDIEIHVEITGDQSFAESQNRARSDDREQDSSMTNQEKGTGDSGAGEQNDDSFGVYDNAFQNMSNTPMGFANMNPHQMMQMMQNMQNMQMGGFNPQFNSMSTYRRFTCTGTVADCCSGAIDGWIWGFIWRHERNDGHGHEHELQSTNVWRL